MPAYHPFTKFLHWTMALLIIGMLAMGLLLDDIPQAWKGTAYGLHKSFGIVILALAFLRALWWLTQTKPTLVDTLPAWSKPLINAGHNLLYVFMFLMPLSGWLMSNAGGYPVAVFGYQLPTLLEKNREVAGFFHEVHEVSANILIALVVAHVAAALVHHYYFRDDTLIRMTRNR